MKYQGAPARELYDAAQAASGLLTWARRWVGEDLKKFDEGHERLKSAIERAWNADYRSNKQAEAQADQSAAEGDAK